MRAVTHHLSGMIEEVLTYASLEARREKVRPESVRPAEIMHAVQAVLEPMARQKAIEFVVDAPADLPEMLTDPDKVRQILMNLAANGVKFTEQGEVRLAARTGTEEGPNGARNVMRFSVADSGIGIPEHDLPRLFHPFTQLDGGLTRRFGGTGLGLYISQRLAELLGAHIDVRSVEGEGSVFELVVPVG
jgi:signal transduction histidine kinase